MSAIKDRTTEVSPGSYFVHLFEVDADQFQAAVTKAPRPAGQ